MSDRDHLWSFRCFDCHRPAFLIQGSCDWCEPELHAAYHAHLAAYIVAAAAFTAATGKHPLDDWDAFERWGSP